jgi:nicotinamidase/pyrazinamidase
MIEFPSFYDPDRIGTLFYPDPAAIAAEAEESALSPAAEDGHRLYLLIVDMQVDFCHQGGTLYVPGAEGDIRRLIEFIFRNAEQITKIGCSLDSHLPYQIFHPSWWSDEHGSHPEPYTVIRRQDMEQGKWRPLLLPDWSRRYLELLEEEAKKQLVIWPYHVTIGAVGNMLDPELWSAVFWHSLARKAQPAWLVKGSIPRTEHYSVIGPEIPVTDHPQGQPNSHLLAELEGYDSIVVAGEAMSHCVLETVEDLVDAYTNQPSMLRKVFVLSDCTSPVQHPEIDFRSLALRRFAEFEEQGINFVASTDPAPYLR